MIENDPLDQVLEKYTPAIMSSLLNLRDLIEETAAESQAVKSVSGSLKWGQPSYEAVKPKTGSPIRIDAIKGTDTGYAMYFICTTTLVGEMRERYGDTLTFEGNRAMIFDTCKTLHRDAVKHCIAMALTYKLNKTA